MLAHAIAAPPQLPLGQCSLLTRCVAASQAEQTMQSYASIRYTGSVFASLTTLLDPDGERTRLPTPTISPRAPFFF